MQRGGLQQWATKNVVKKGGSISSVYFYTTFIPFALRLTYAISPLLLKLEIPLRAHRPSTLRSFLKMCTRHIHLAWFPLSSPSPSPAPFLTAKKIINKVTTAFHKNLRHPCSPFFFLCFHPDGFGGVGGACINNYSFPLSLSTQITASFFLFLLVVPQADARWPLL